MLLMMYNTKVPRRGGEGNGQTGGFHGEFSHGPFDLKNRNLIDQSRLVFGYI
jgi:hypothetical protein